jgi:hypothetical protein
MWQGVARRDWPPTGLTTTQWMDIPTQFVRIADLYATQHHLHVHALTTTPPPTYGPDPIVHIVIWQGMQCIEDGHHRVVRAALKGHSHIRARVIQL